MKPILGGLLAFCLLFMSCSTDAEKQEDPNENTSLIGTWYFIAYIDDEGQQDPNGCDNNDFIRFNEDDTFDFAYYYIEGEECITRGDQTGQWSYASDGILELVYNEQETREVGYVIEENILTLTIDEGLGEYQEKYEKEE
ncbi:lipocalin family protein [Flagellimonas sp.]|uniref:lipocalin family protein n=1 Tax=Flagellimonas sp. TaxID=2058762 RepID=UPI003B515E72